MSKAYQENYVQQLKGFYYTAYLGSVSKAAKFLYLSQPSISLQIKALENTLNVQLFKRKSKKMFLTEHGKVFFKEAKAVLENIDSLFNKYKLAAKVEPTLRIVANHGSMQYILPKKLKSFRQKFPDQKIEVIYANADEGVKHLDSGADIYITPLSFDFSDDYTIYPVVSFPIYLMAHKNHPISKLKKISLTDIANYDITLPSDDMSVFRGVKALMHSKGIDYEPKLSFRNWELMKNFVHEDLTMSIVTGLVLQTKDPNLFIYDMSEYFEPVTYCMLVPKFRTVPDYLQEFIDSPTSFDNQ